MLGGVLVCFIGIALLTPVISRPVVAVLGRLLSWSAAGTLGRRNSARNPRRTAITAAALMVGVALVTAISVVFTSIQASAVETIEADLDADIVIAADPLSGGFGAIDPEALAAIRDLPEIASVVGVYGDLGQVNGTIEFLTSFDDPGLGARTFGMTLVSGTLAPIDAGQTIVDDQTASDRGLTVGSTVTIRTARGDPEQMTIIGTYERSSVTVSGFVVSPSSAASGFASPVPSQAYAAVAPGANVDTALTKVQDVLKDSPEVNAITVDDYVASQRQFFDIALALVQFLLAFAMIIAVLGVINTLLLSMVERTRELGLLRAVGMKRGQMMWMVTVEVGRHLRLRRPAGHRRGRRAWRCRLPGTARPGLHCAGLPVAVDGRVRGRLGIRRTGGGFDPGPAGGPNQRASGHRVRVTAWSSTWPAPRSWCGPRPFQRLAGRERRAGVNPEVASGAPPRGSPRSAPPSDRRRCDVRRRAWETHSPGRVPGVWQSRCIACRLRCIAIAITPPTTWHEYEGNTGDERGTGPAARSERQRARSAQRDSERHSRDLHGSDAAVRAAGLWKVYGTGEAQVIALRGVDVSMERGRFTAIMGPSGSGKSTLMHCLAGLDTVTRGEVHIGETALTGLSDNGLTTLRRDKVGFVFQQFNLLPTLSAEENILLPLAIAGRKPDPGWFDTVIDAVGLRDRLGHRPAQLSGGQQQRVACARAMVSRPEVIFADEPTGNLDSRSGAEVLGFLRDSVRQFGQTVVMVTHDPNAASYADRVIFLADGRVVDELTNPTAEAVLDTMKRLDTVADTAALAASRTAVVIRATLKSLLSRKLRLILSGLAVILGVMFVSGSFVLTDTLDALVRPALLECLRQHRRAGVGAAEAGAGRVRGQRAGDRRR